MNLRSRSSKRTRTPDAVARAYDYAESPPKTPSSQLVNQRTIPPAPKKARRGRVAHEDAEEIHFVPWPTVRELLSEFNFVSSLTDQQLMFHMGFYDNDFEEKFFELE